MAQRRYSSDSLQKIYVEKDPISLYVQAEGDEMSLKTVENDILCNLPSLHGSQNKTEEVVTGTCNSCSTL